MEKHSDLSVKDALEYISPSELDYQEWLNVGMGLKEAGVSVALWDDWSRRDPRRYHSGECEKKWATFRGSGNPITAGTVIQMALTRGWQPACVGGRELGWEEVIGGKEDLVVVNKNWIEGKDVMEPSAWNPANHLITYLETLFDSTERVGYVTRSFEKDGKYMPERGCWDRTAGRLIEELSRCGGDVGKVLGDYNPDVGAWIRFNPLDGNGIRNENVTEFRYALVESDSMDVEKQHAIIHELELPVAALVHSGGKSLHAIVRVDAGNYEEYRKRVDYLYAVCRKNGLDIDQQNRNPSRLSRMPGVTRKGNKQFLMATNIGKSNWAEWNEWIESVNDDLPDPENMSDVWDNLPDLAPPLISGVLRKGHKLLLAGPSKAGKSYALIELCCAIAEGQQWMGFDCAQGRVMYVNLELDRASCLHRFKDVYAALGWDAAHLSAIDIWNLRGQSVPMDKLAPKLIRRATKKDYAAIIIDPIYKVITGDENSADQMAHFCNQFDKVCTSLGCAVIYCHHHSKGSQGSKRSMDRASGSGVFARDPDAMLDLIELDVSDDLQKQEANNAICAVCADTLRHAGQLDAASQDDLCSERAALEACSSVLTEVEHDSLLLRVEAARRAITTRTAWRIEGTLREFPKFPPVNVWFDYPIHKGDASGALKDIQPDETAAPWSKNFRRKKPPEQKKKDVKASLESAIEACGFSGSVTIGALAEYMGVTEKTVRNRIKSHGGYWIDEGVLGKK